MHPFIRAICLGLLISAPTQAGFVIRLEQKQLQADQADETIGIFLKSTFASDVQIKSMQIGAFIGSQEDVIDFGSEVPKLYRDSEGNFNKTAYEGGIELNTAGHFWSAPPATPLELYANTWGHNVAQASVEFIRDRNNLDVNPGYRVLGAGQEVKVGTFHIDTTNVAGDQLKISLYGQDQYLKFGTTEPFTVTNIVTLDQGVFAVSDSSAFTIDAHNTFTIAHTPEPSVIGFAGLSAAAGFGWVRSRLRRRKSAT